MVATHNKMSMILKKGLCKIPNQTSRGPAPNAPTRCTAVILDGTVCSGKIDNGFFAFCINHYNERNDLHDQYDKKQYVYHARKSVHGDDPSVDAMEELILLGTEVLSLQNQLHRRFFACSQNYMNKDDMKNVLTIQLDLDQFKSRLTLEKFALGGEDCNMAESDSDSAMHDKEQVKQYQSLLSPNIPCSALGKLPKDHYVVVFRRSIDNLRFKRIKRIYEILPSLNDSQNLIFDSQNEEGRVVEKDDLILRHVFREFVVWSGDADIVTRASQAETIDTYLRTCTAELPLYISFLEAFMSGSKYTSYFLRAAISNYLLAANDAAHRTILGAKIRLESDPRLMGVEEWDILFTNFSHKNMWLLLGQFCTDFKEIALIKKLIALGRYTCEDNLDLSWSRQKDDLSQTFQLATLLGFQIQMICPSRANRTIEEVEGGIFTENERRGYTAGRIHKGDWLGMKLIQDLLTRVARFIVCIYDGEGSLLPQLSNGVETTWIARTRSATSQHELSDSVWKTDLSVIEELKVLNTLYSPHEFLATGDYYQLIIIDRLELQPNMLSSMLMQLSGPISVPEVYIKAVRDILPSTEQDDWLKTQFGSIPTLVTTTVFVPKVSYQGNRLRAWDILQHHSDIVLKPQNKGFRTQSPDDGTMLNLIFTNLETTGLISKVLKFQQTQTLATLIQGTDGYSDVYFDFSHRKGLGAIMEAGSESDTDYLVEIEKHTSNPLLRLDGLSLQLFAQEFKSKNPDAVFAKARIRTHYCAWPFIISTIPLVQSDLLFSSPEGHIYRWNQMPFDYPTATCLWQLKLHNDINCKLPFVRATQTTVLICAASPAQIDANIASLQAVAAKMCIRVLIPNRDNWTAELDALNIRTLWSGIKPACLEK